MELVDDSQMNLYHILRDLQEFYIFSISMKYHLLDIGFVLYPISAVPKTRAIPILYTY